MRVEDLEAFVEAEPFRPFRVVLSGGRVRDVLRRDMAFLSRDCGALFYGDLSADQVRTCEIIPVDRIERVELVQPSPPAP